MLSGIQGQYTKIDGYQAFFEICNWQTSINPDIQSAVGKSGDKWAGYETVDSANVKLDFVVEKGFAGIMWWAMDLDDFNGNFCGGEKYPLLSQVYKNLKEKAKEPQVNTMSF